MFALVCCFSLIGTLPQAEIQGSESEVTFTITSEAHPVLSDAVAESHGELHKLAWQWLSDNSSNLPPQGRESLPSWLQTASSRRTESSEAIDRAYGRLHQHRLSVSVPRNSLAKFAADIAEKREIRVKRVLRRLTVFSVVLMAGWGVTLFLDRWTRGYRRRPIMIAACVVSTLLGVAIVGLRS